MVRHGRVWCSGSRVRSRSNGRATRLRPSHQALRVAGTFGCRGHHPKPPQGVRPSDRGNHDCKASLRPSTCPLQDAACSFAKHSSAWIQASCPGSAEFVPRRGYAARVSRISIFRYFDISRIRYMCDIRKHILRKEDRCRSGRRSNQTSSRIFSG